MYIKLKGSKVTKSLRIWFTYYLTLSGKIAATAIHKELYTRQNALLVQLGCIYKAPVNWFLRNKTVICFILLLLLSAPGPN